MKIKNALLRLLDHSLGKVLRYLYVIMVPKQTVVHNIQTHMSEIAVQQSAEYAIANMQTALIFDTRQELWTFCISRIRKSEIIGSSFKPVFAEFGVFNGASITYFANLLPEFQIAGFDSFIGLEEDWPGTYHPAGYFDLNGVLPKVPKNVTLHPGWFEDTVPGFLDSLSPEDWAPVLLHLDADTYTPTKFLLESFASKIRRGTLLIFDEYFGYPFWQNGEFKAFQEFIANTGLKYSYLACSGQQVAIEFS